MNWGKLWVEYDVTFRIPQLNPGSGASASLGGSVASGGTLASANPLGDAPVPDANNSGFTVDNSSVVTFTSLGTYLISLKTDGNNAAPIVFTPGAGAAVTGQVTSDTGPLGSASMATVVVSSLVAATVAITVTGLGGSSGAILEIGSAPTGSLP